eukprot:4681530-Pyramimonas_sp.AAC.1
MVVRLDLFSSVHLRGARIRVAVIGDEFLDPQRACCQAIYHLGSVGPGLLWELAAVHLHLEIPCCVFRCV